VERPTTGIKRFDNRRLQRSRGSPIDEHGSALTGSAVIAVGSRVGWRRGSSVSASVRGLRSGLRRHRRGQSSTYRRVLLTLGLTSNQGADYRPEWDRKVQRHGMIWAMRALGLTVEAG
jgi:hypothetical protein